MQENPVMIGHEPAPTATLPRTIACADERARHSTAAALQWAVDTREELVAELRRCGAILLRGLAIEGADAFERLAQIYCGPLSNYLGGNSPRTRVQGNVFTTTEYPASEKISLHNEGSYLRRMPRLVLFHCEVPPVDRGQTPLADSRLVYRATSPLVRDRFAVKRVKYINNLHGGTAGIGKSWQTAFQTDSKREVERRLEADGCEYEWKSDGGLRTSIVANGVAVHPDTGETVWINQAEQWHPSGLSPVMRRALAAVLPERDFPHNACYGDGSPFDEADLAHVRTVMATHEQTFEWQKRDVLVCDNWLVMHGRQPFSGPRRILAALG